MIKRTPSKALISDRNENQYPPQPKRRGSRWLIAGALLLGLRGRIRRSPTIQVHDQHAATTHPVRWRRFLLAFLLSIGLVVLLGPRVLATYHLWRADTALSASLTWPADRTLTLPVTTDMYRVDQAIAQLQAAQRWRPADAHRWQMLGEAQAARSDWLAAADAFEQAGQLAPANPLYRAQAALVYERMAQQVAASPPMPIQFDWDATQIDAPEQAIETPYCDDGVAATCYVAQTSIAQELAAAPTVTVSATSIFIHPPASAGLPLTVPDQQTAVAFVFGVDPAAHAWGSDGGVFQLRVRTADGTEQPIFEHTLTAPDVPRGWISGWADLAAWRGQAITLLLHTEAGAAGDARGDWFGWGDWRWIRPDVAPFASLYPADRMQQAWAAAGVAPEAMLGRANAAFGQAHMAEADAWYQRAQLVQPAGMNSVPFQAEVAAIVSGRTISQTAGLKLYPLPARIQAETLQWARPDYAGVALAALGGGADVGRMWWNGAAVAGIEVPQTGIYSVTLRVQHTAPAPVQLQLERDFQAVEAITLSRGDDSWQNMVVSMELTAGQHIIGVRFLNNGIVDGVDRDAVLDWLDIRREEQ